MKALQVILAGLEGVTNTKKLATMTLEKDVELKLLELMSRLKKKDSVFNIFKNCKERVVEISHKLDRLRSKSEVHK